MNTADNLHVFLQEQEIHLMDIDMSGSLYLEFLKTENNLKNDNSKHHT